MLRMYLWANWVVVKFTFGLLSQFTWFQNLLYVLQRSLLILAEAWLWWIGLVIIGAVFWDFLPIVSLGMFAYWIYRWRCPSNNW